MKRCKSNHNHPGELSRRMCDAELAQRVREDRAARPAQWQPIEPTIPATPRWLNQRAADLTGRIGSN